MFQKRVNQVIEKMKTDGLKQILVSEPCSIYYLTGVDVGPGERLFALYLNDEGRKVLFLNTLFHFPLYSFGFNIIYLLLLSISSLFFMFLNLIFHL